MAAPSYTLELEGQRAVVCAVGGRAAAYSVEGHQVLAGEENPELFAFRGALLAPWPNRVVGGHWTWQGSNLQLPVNDPAAGSALHGLVYDAVFSVAAVNSCSISLEHVLLPQPGYPFRLRLDVTYELTPAGLSCSLTATNTGEDSAPVGLGVHPYIAAPAAVDDLLLTLPAKTLLETDAAWQETGRLPVQNAGVDFRVPRRLGDLVLDAAFTDMVADADGRTEARIGLPDGRDVVLWSGRTCRWWVVYTGHTLPAADYRRSIAVEPMTCPPNALATGEIDILEPGESLPLDWGFSLH